MITKWWLQVISQRPRLQSILMNFPITLYIKSSLFSILKLFINLKQIYDKSWCHEWWCEFVNYFHVIYPENFKAPCFVIIINAYLIHMPCIPHFWSVHVFGFAQTESPNMIYTGVHSFQLPGVWGPNVAGSHPIPECTSSIPRFSGPKFQEDQSPFPRVPRSQFQWGRYYTDLSVDLSSLYLPACVMWK